MKEGIRQFTEGVKDYMTASVPFLAATIIMIVVIDASVTAAAEYGVRRGINEFARYICETAEKPVA